MASKPSAAAAAAAAAVDPVILDPAPRTGAARARDANVSPQLTDLFTSCTSYGFGPDIYKRNAASGLSEGAHHYARVLNGFDNVPTTNPVRKFVRAVEVGVLRGLNFMDGLHKPMLNTSASSNFLQRSIKFIDSGFRLLAGAPSFLGLEKVSRVAWPTLDAANSKKIDDIRIDKLGYLGTFFFCTPWRIFRYAAAIALKLISVLWALVCRSASLPVMGAWTLILGGLIIAGAGVALGVILLDLVSAFVIGYDFLGLLKDTCVAEEPGSKWIKYSFFYGLLINQLFMRCCGAPIARLVIEKAVNDKSGDFATMVSGDNATVRNVFKSAHHPTNYNSTDWTTASPVTTGRPSTGSAAAGADPVLVITNPPAVPNALPALSAAAAAPRSVPAGLPQPIDAVVAGNPFAAVMSPPSVAGPAPVVIVATPLPADEDFDALAHRDVVDAAAAPVPVTTAPSVPLRL